MGEVGRLGAVGRVELWMDCAEEDRDVSVKASAMATQMGVRVSFMGSPLVLRIREGLWSVVQRIRMVYGERPRCAETPEGWVPDVEWRDSSASIPLNRTVSCAGHD